jgi:predicted O-methyltransferase YrrM
MKNTTRISVEALTGRAFRFGRADGSSLGEVTLAAQGVIMGYQNVNERFWTVEGGKLIFHGHDGAPTTIFEQVTPDEGEFAFSGEFLPYGLRAWHILNEAVKPAPAPIINELARELYGDDTPLAYADLRYRDDGYPHTNLIPEVIATVLDLVRPNFWLELGSMLGGSAIRVADIVKGKGMETEIVCIDPFTGDVNMWAWEQGVRAAGQWQYLRLERGRPSIYDRFLANVTVAGHQDIILPIAATSIVGTKLLRRLKSDGRISSLPSVIYLDSAHEPGETLLELENCWDILEPGGILLGDDWSWGAVREDVLRFARTVEPNRGQMERLLARHQRFVGQEGVLLDRGQWVIAK